MNKNKLLSLLFFLVALFVFHADTSAASTVVPLDISTPAVWNKAGSPYIVKSQVNIKSELTIEPGVIVKFGKNGWMNIMHDLSIRGTESEKIFFTSLKNDALGGDTNEDGDATFPAKKDWGYLNVNAHYNVNFEYVHVSYADMGVYASQYGYSSFNTGIATIKRSTIQYNNRGIYISKEQPVIEDNIISNNDIGIYVNTDLKYGIPVVRNNFIADNGKGVEAFMYYGDQRKQYLDARNNWWGDLSGPYFIHTSYGEDNPEGKGNSVSDGIMFDPWLEKDPSKVREPLILVPGIGASVNWDVMVGGAFTDNWKLYDHTYDGIIEAVKNMGYEEGKDFFICYYDWRKNNADSAKDFLKPLIEKAVALNGSPKVNIVAHSMGGLVARSYVQSEEYANDVDNLILIAAPNKGSSDVYTVWEGGRIPDSWENRGIIKGYLAYFNAKKLTFSNYETIHKYISSVKELMPVYDYVYPKEDENQTTKNYSEMQERNDFLESLNQDAEINKLNNRVKLSIIAGDEQNTLHNIPIVSASDEDPLWKDGKPDPLDPEKDTNNGDGRVTLDSAVIEGLYKSVLNYSHGDLVSQSEKIIASRILEKLDVIYPAPDVPEEMGFWFASPVDVQIKAPDGNIISKDINTIPLAIYSGESKSDGFKMVLIPNPQKGDYEITITGNGDGEYHIGSEFADYTGRKPDHSSLVEGNIKKDEKKEYKIAYDPDNTSAPVTEIIPQNNDTTPPVITGSATTEPNANGWYNHDVTVHFEASDSESGIASVTPDQIISSEGANQSIIGTAIDNAGNSASVTVSGINIDKTTPQISISSPENKTYLNDQNIPIAQEISETLSGLDWEQKYFDGELFDKDSLDLSLLHLGNHSFKISAQDKADNQSESEIQFSIRADIYSIQNNISHYAELGLIEKTHTKKFLLRKIRELVRLMNRLNGEKNSDKWKEKINRKIDKLIEKIQKTDRREENENENEEDDFEELYKNKFQISQPAMDLLVESLNSLKFY